ncbi:conserved hypothetical protein [Pyrobaculum islandicum DSM 4184]|uniref:Peptidase A2 domain-containing protein n=1 Tax=Pyrobaculum islandicum (strain DSM 4184 / JCM 9189 / GEO3) TaxID=384616 RepID=A1RVZ4_PYRIL|nr:aspartyl protease family protein [Pyrobaculum islandicum]ABL89126.1 conserved hypothetical protein [Pyrobaculum islandicum DSM 4184]
MKVRVKIFNPVEPGTSLEVEALVDTGAIYNVVGRDLLERLGVKPLEKTRFRVFGGVVEREVGVELIGRRRTAVVVFGETGDPVVLGVTALEALGLTSLGGF